MDYRTARETLKRHHGWTRINTDFAGDNRANEEETKAEKWRQKHAGLQIPINQASWLKHALTAVITAARLQCPGCFPLVRQKHEATVTGWTLQSQGDKTALAILRKGKTGGKE